MHEERKIFVPPGADEKEERECEFEGIGLALEEDSHSEVAGYYVGLRKGHRQGVDLVVNRVGEREKPWGQNRRSERGQTGGECFLWPHRLGKLLKSETIGFAHE